jgi:hypothetical protein
LNGKEEALIRALESGDDPTKLVEQSEMLGLAVQELGFRVRVGILPLGPLLVATAMRIVSDWRMFEVTRVRKEQDWTKTHKHVDGQRISWRRRHGEWLAHLAAMYVLQEWRETSNSTDMEKFVDVDRCKAIYESDKKWIPRSRQLEQSLKQLMDGYKASPRLSTPTTHGTQVDALVQDTRSDRRSETET